jgi:tetratricopeptide (TPR) repeat protein
MSGQKHQILWIVKKSAGHTKGPYTTEALLRLIGEGVFSGNEMVSKYPGGEWTVLSKEAQFYDKLLETLESSVENPKNFDGNADAETVIGPIPEHLKNPRGAKSAPLLQELPVKKSSASSSAAASPKAPPAAQRPSSNHSVIELENLGKAQRKEALKSAKVPLILVSIALLMVIYILLPEAADPGEKISLLAPTKGAAAMSDQQVKEKLAGSIAAIEKDTVESYLEAQNKLVAIVEGAPNTLEVRGLLCLVYKELWPYAKQDANDLRAISSVTQSTRILNSVGLYGSLCEIVNLETSGRFKEARGVVESALENAGRFSLLAILYQFKAELLEADKDYLNATPYYQKATQLWDGWVKPKKSLGVVAEAQGQGPTAAQYFQKILAKNPTHREVKIHLGILQYKSFKQEETAFTILKAAMDSKSKVPRELESEGYFILSQIYITKGQKSLALSAAQSAYGLAPNNPQYKQLLVRLGGTDKLKDKNVNNELMFVGDQYARTGDCLAAQAEFKAAFESDPKNGMAAVKAARCLWQLNQSFEAVEWLNKAIKAEPKLITAYVLQADYQSQRYDFAAASSVLTNAARVAPNNYEVYRGMALLEFRRNNMTGAINFAQKALRVYDADIETYALLAKASAAMYAGMVTTTKKEIETRENYQRDAIRYATKAVELDTTNPEAQITYAKVMAQINGVDSGVSYMRELIKKYSYSQQYKVALAEIFKSEERYQQALELYQSVTETDVKNKKAFIGQGECYKALGQIDRSLKAFLSAAVLDPSDGEALFQTGKLYLESNRFDEAIAQFKRVQNITPHFPRTYYFIGKAAFMSGNYAVAIEAAKREKQGNPNLADSYLLAGEIYNAKKQFAECAVEYSQAMKLRPQGADIYVKAAQCYRQSGSVDVAQDLLAMAASRESGNADIYKEQGAIYELKGDSRAAVQSYNKYIGLSPNATDRGEIEARINHLGGTVE